MIVIFNKKARCPWTEKDVKKMIDFAARAARVSGNVEVNVIGEKLIKKLNFQYRGVDKVTDVLSFAWLEDKVVKAENIGEIYLCHKRIVRQAREFGVSPKEEFTRILIHGFLHLLGYDHQTKNQAVKMFGLQEAVVKKFKKVL
ncbi:MAG: rRNA maturation RNase YbeY [Patescibacteria group bacterium]